jgi:hypothetical protein
VKIRAVETKWGHEIYRVYFDDDEKPASVWRIVDRHNFIPVAGGPVTSMIMEQAQAERAFYQTLKEAE